MWAEFVEQFVADLLHYRSCVNAHLQDYLTSFGTKNYNLMVHWAVALKVLAFILQLEV
jgi:hypothetical protein